MHRFATERCGFGARRPTVRVADGDPTRAAGIDLHTVRLQAMRILGWAFLVRATPSTVRGRVDVAGRRSLAVLVAYVRATAAVAVVRSTPSVLG